MKKIFLFSLLAFILVGNFTEPVEAVDPGLTYRVLHSMSTPDTLIGSAAKHEVSIGLIQDGHYYPEKIIILTQVTFDDAEADTLELDIDGGYGDKLAVIYNDSTLFASISANAVMKYVLNMVDTSANVSTRLELDWHMPGLSGTAAGDSMAFKADVIGLYRIPKAETRR